MIELSEKGPSRHTTTMHGIHLLYKDHRLLVHMNIFTHYRDNWAFLADQIVKYLFQIDDGTILS